MGSSDGDRAPDNVREQQRPAFDVARRTNHARIVAASDRITCKPCRNSRKSICESNKVVLRR
jgi:hypothetical protein